MPEEPQPGELVSWETTRKLAEDIDKLLIERIADPRKDGDMSTALLCRDPQYRFADFQSNGFEGSAYISSSYAPTEEAHLLCTDITTPFPLKFPMNFGVYNEFPNARVFQRYEFAYYNYGPRGEYLFKEIHEGKRADMKYSPRFYWDNGRQPVQTASYVTFSTGSAGDKEFDFPLRGSRIINRDNLNNMCKDMDEATLGTLLYNLTESHRHVLYKQWPIHSHCSSESTISSELFFITEPGYPFNCRAMLRLAPVSLDHNHNGNFNGKPTRCSTQGEGCLYERPYRAAGSTHPTSSHNIAANPSDHETRSAMIYTFASRKWDSYVPEFHRYTDRSDLDSTKLYTMPPICSGCQDVGLPYMGLEGGTKAWRDGSNWGKPGSTTGIDGNSTLNFNDLGDRPTELWDENVFHSAFIGAVTAPYTPVVDWDPEVKKRPYIPPDKLGRYKLRLRMNRDPEFKRDFKLRYRYCKQGYRKYWCHPEDLDYYEKVSRYEVWRIGDNWVVTRVTPMRFRKKFKPVRINGKLVERPDHYDFVWVPTAFNFHVKGQFVPAIRKRWYDLLAHRAKYLCGFWRPSYFTEGFIKCTDKEYYSGDYEFTEKPWPKQFKQKWNGMDDERDINFVEGSGERITQSIGHPCIGGLSWPRHTVDYSSSEMPEGVTWDYDCETVWNPLDMQCARWLAEGPSTTGSSLAPGWDPETPGVSISCGAYFGTRYWDHMIATLNVVGNIIDDNNYELTFNYADGGLCTRLDEKGDGCSEPYPETFEDPHPWWGGCKNTVCKLDFTRGVPIHNVHAFTLQMLRRLVTFIQEHKHVEHFLSGWVATDDWKACSPDLWESPKDIEWRWETEITQDYTVTVTEPTPTEPPTPYYCDCDFPYGIISNWDDVVPYGTAGSADCTLRLVDGAGMTISVYNWLHQGIAQRTVGDLITEAINGGNGRPTPFNAYIGAAGQGRVEAILESNCWNACGAMLELIVFDGSKLISKAVTYLTECDTEPPVDCDCDFPYGMMGDGPGGEFKSVYIALELVDGTGTTIATLPSTQITSGTYLTYHEMLATAISRSPGISSYVRGLSTYGTVEATRPKNCWNPCGAVLKVTMLYGAAMAYADEIELDCDDKTDTPTEPPTEPPTESPTDTPTDTPTDPPTGPCDCDVPYAILDEPDPTFVEHWLYAMYISLDDGNGNPLYDKQFSAQVLEHSDFYERVASCISGDPVLSSYLQVTGNRIEAKAPNFWASCRAEVSISLYSMSETFWEQDLVLGCGEVTEPPTETPTDPPKPRCFGRVSHGTQTLAPSYNLYAVLRKQDGTEIAVVPFYPRSTSRYYIAQAAVDAFNSMRQYNVSANFAAAGGIYYAEVELDTVDNSCCDIGIRLVNNVLPSPRTYDWFATTTPVSTVRSAAPVMRMASVPATVEEALPAAAALLEATSIPARDVQEVVAECDKWNEVDHGTWKYYWCSTTAYGVGQLTYEEYQLLSGCYSGEEAGWAGRVETFLPSNVLVPDALRAAEKPKPPNAGEEWWPDGGSDYCLVKVECSSDKPVATGMVWCPYLLSEGVHRVRVEVYSPMKRGPRKANQNAVRGWVDGYCEPSGYGTCDARAEGETGSLCAADPERYACDENTPLIDDESIFSINPPCPRITDMNEGGGCNVLVWTAGWEADVRSLGGGSLRGNGTCEGYAYDINEYMREALNNPSRGETYMIVEGSISVGRKQNSAAVRMPNNQYRGYIGLSIELGAFAVPGKGLPGYYDNIEKYVYCPHDEYLLVKVTVLPPYAN